MALTKAQLMELPGNVIPVGAVKVGTGLTLSPEGVMALNAADNCLQLVAGPGSTVSPASGVGVVTVGLPPQSLQDPVVLPGDKMFFFNATAPSGWTKDTSVNDMMIRVTSSTGGGQGGASPFSSAFTTFTPQGGVSGVSAVGTIDQTAISQGQLPSHTHSYESRDCAPVGIEPVPGGNLARCQQATGSTGGNGSHTHAFNGSITGGFAGQTTNQFSVKYIDCILCTKD
jgi:hypothetical protein